MKNRLNEKLERMSQNKEDQELLDLAMLGYDILKLFKDCRAMRRYDAQSMVLAVFGVGVGEDNIE